MGNLNITVVDVVVIGVLLGSAGFAFLRGFVQEVLSITSWVGAIFATLYGFSTLQPFFRSQIGVPWAADAATGASLFLVTLLVLSLVTKRVSDRVRQSAMNSVDSSLGFVFGLARGAVLLSLAFLAAAWLFDRPDHYPAWLAEARSRPWLERGGNMLKALAPEGFGQAELKARSVSSETRQMIEAEQTFQKFVSPQPAVPSTVAPGATPAPARPAPVYDSESRAQMERLIRGNQ
ncbi:CvpA family protein [Magnetospirillum fulvum]|uniref:Membrane protein required for colicin V production n=1 Tax=Magnetospirillum fulvum TaxID=1082 RepID=A0A1H6H6F2_MAGFU|nr:CvpA family protein [Magnetospirillum fulvum]SEH30996.1 membrane protein required for colicin V production [Magnetospirillum fulvum]